MLNPVNAQVSSQEYSKLEKLGKKLKKIYGTEETYQVAISFAYKMHQRITEHFEEGWVFWYTDSENTIEAFRLTHPLSFRFAASRDSTKRMLGYFEEDSITYILYALNYFAQAVEMVELGYLLRRSRGQVLEDVTDSFGLSVFKPMKQGKIITLKR